MSKTFLLWCIMSFGFKRIVVLTLLLSSSSLFAQSPFYHYFQDTIKPGFRISGSLDSTDVQLGNYQTTLPRLHNQLPISFSQLSAHHSIPFVRRFSSIPHVGLRYSMGSNSTQLGAISYTQAIDSFSVVQFDYQRFSSNGALRNSSSEVNAVQLAVLHHRKRFASTFSLSFFGATRGLNGGLLNDTLTEPDFDLIFQPVAKENAIASERDFHADWKNYLSFTKDSLLKTGLFSAINLSVRNRRYTETSDTLFTLYSNVFYDSTNTNDLWQKSQVSGTAGYFFHTPQVALDAGLALNYWDFDNKNQHSDTVEVSIVGNALLQLESGWKWQNNGLFTFIGAAGETELKSSLVKSLSFGSMAAFADFTRKYPQNYQRTFDGNNIRYSWQNKEFTTALKVGGNIHVTAFNIPIDVRGQFIQTDKLPVFLINQWRQDTLIQLTFAQLVVRTSLQFRSLFLQPSVSFQSSTQGIFPNFSANARLGFNGALFKAKRLKAVVGFDLGYTNTYQLLDFSPQMDAFQFSSSGVTFTAMPKIHFFSQFDLGYLRWFVRLENIEQFFQASTNYQAVGYPVVPFQIRFGVSWDLFN